MSNLLKTKTNFLLQINDSPLSLKSISLSQEEASKDEESSIIKPNNSHLTKWSSEIIGYVNGLLCIKDAYTRELAFLNPSLKHLKLLPSPPKLELENHKILKDVVGFGYDSFNNDFKIVRIRYNDIDKSWISVSIFSLRKNSWKVLNNTQVLSYHYSFHCSRHTMSSSDGSSFYWLVKKTRRDDRFVILKFDFVNESFREMKLPCCFKDDVGCIIGMGEIRGKLSLSVHGSWGKSSPPIYLEIWSMDEDFSWGEEFKFQVELGDISWCLAMNDECILLETSEACVFYYDLHTMEITNLGVQDMVPKSCAFSYKPSMALLGEEGNRWYY